MIYNPVANFGTHSLGLEPISEEHTECCRNICPEKLEKHEIEHCLDRSLPYQGWIFLWKWLSHQIASAESSWNNNHHYVIFWQKLKLSENDLILIHSKLQWVKYFLSLMKKKKNLKVSTFSKTKFGDCCLSQAQHSKSESGEWEDDSLLLKIIFLSHENKLLNVFITDNGWDYQFC